MRGVCAFDIDHTLTCGDDKCDSVQSMLDGIAMCRRYNMGIAINTARPPQHNVLWGIDRRILDELGPDVHVYTRPRGSRDVPMHKLYNNNEISNEFNVPLDRVVLIDDLKETCDLMMRHNHPVVHVTGRAGMTRNEVDRLHETLDGLAHRT